MPTIYDRLKPLVDTLAVPRTHCITSDPMRSGWVQVETAPFPAGVEEGVFALLPELLAHIEKLEARITELERRTAPISVGSASATGASSYRDDVTIEEGQEWLDTSTTPSTLRVYRGGSWIPVEALASSDVPIYRGPVGVSEELQQTRRRSLDLASYPGIGVTRIISLGDGE